jgi:hypothetical protein
MSFISLFSERLDHDLVTSRKSLLEAKSLGKSKSEDEKKSAGEEEAVHLFSNKNKEKMQQRKYQQAEKKKKKKKQKQKEKVKATDEKEAPDFKVKSKAEIRREELEKAGVLSPTNVVSNGNEQEKMSNVSKEINNSKIKDDSLPPLKSADILERNQKNETNFDKEAKEIGREWSIMQAQKANSNYMSSIDSAVAYLSEPEQALAYLNNNKLPSPTKSSNVRDKYGWSESLKDTATDTNRTYTWSNRSADGRRNTNKLYGSFSNSESDQKVVTSHIKSNDWIKSASRLENTYGVKDSKHPGGMRSFVGSLGKSMHENRLPHFRDFLDKAISKNRRPAFGGSLDKYVSENKAHSWKKLQPGVNRWSGLNPREERRYYSGDPVYNSPNQGWPRFSVESLKHGNLAENVKTWPNLPIDQSMDSNKESYSIDETSDTWPNFHLGIHTSMQNPYAYNWPKYTDSTSQNSITSSKISAWSKPSLDPSMPKETKVNTNTWSHVKHPHQKPVSAIDTTLAHHTKDASSSKQWPHFAYHRVTSSPEILAQQQKEAQQRARHRNAYIAVSVIAPPGKSKGLNKTQNKNNGSLLQTPEKAWNKVNEPPTEPPATPLPDKIDQLLAMRSEKEKFPDGEDLLEEQLVDMAVAGQQQHSAMPWSHARHLDKIQVLSLQKCVWYICFRQKCCTSSKV